MCNCMLFLFFFLFFSREEFGRAGGGDMHKIHSERVIAYD